MPETAVDLLTLFGSVSKALKESQVSLNEADTFNHNHGDNMVKNFRVINRALKQKADAPVSEQLAYASQKLAKSSKTSSAQIYSQNLAKAAERLEGQPTLNSRNAMSLIQALMGGQAESQPAQSGSGDLLGSLLGAAMGGQEQNAPPQSGSGDLIGSLLGAAMGGQEQNAPPQSGSGDLIGSLLGAAMGGQEQSAPPQSGSGDLIGAIPGVGAGGASQSGSGDLLGSLLGAAMGGQPSGGTPQQGSGDLMSSLLGSLLGGGQAQAPSHPAASSQSGGGLNLGTLLTAGMAYMNATQHGASPLEGLIQAVMAGSQMNSSAHQSQSGQLVAGTLINTLGSLLGGK